MYDAVLSCSVGLWEERVKSRLTRRRAISELVSGV